MFKNLIECFSNIFIIFLSFAHAICSTIFFSAVKNWFYEVKSVSEKKNWSSRWHGHMCSKFRATNICFWDSNFKLVAWNGLIIQTELWHFLSNYANVAIYILADRNQFCNFYFDWQHPIIFVLFTSNFLCMCTCCTTNTQEIWWGKSDKD